MLQPIALSVPLDSPAAAREKLYVTAFMERTLEAVKKPGSNVPYLARDFHVGATIVLNAHRFELIATDERTKATLAEATR